MKVVGRLQDMALDEKYKKITAKVPDKHSRRSVRFAPPQPTSSLEICNRVR